MDALSKNKIKWIRSLRLKKNRDAEGLFVVEGTKIVQEIIANWPSKIECLVTTDTSIPSELKQYETDASTMKSLTSLKTPSSALAVVQKPTFTDNDTGWTLALDGIQDPGNLGTIIRTADWFGVSKIICSHNTVDCFNTKVIQSTMGSIFRVPIFYLDLEATLSNSSKTVYGALLEGENMHSFEPSEEGVLLFGNEGNGISTTLIPSISHPVHIPGKGGAESLNVAVAAGILMGKLIIP